LTITEKEAAAMLRVIMKKISFKTLIKTIPKKDYGLLVLLVIESMIITVADGLRKLHLLPKKPADTSEMQSGFSVTD
jgi:hypothetical protein